MSSLPRDVIKKILLGLPAFDLVRCKGVCKVWRSLISSADFVAAHLQRWKSDPSSHHILVRNRSFDLRRRGLFSSLICFSSADLLIVGSVNGLICIAGKGGGTPSPDDIWILNPVTGLSTKLPYSSHGSYDGHQNIKFAFWCDHDDGGVYKVAKILSNPDGATVLQLWVSTSPDAWTVISTSEFHFHSHPRRFHACDVLIEGLAVYWIVVYCDDDDDDESDYDNGNDDDNDDNDDEIIVVSLDFKSLALTKFIPLSNRQLHMPKNYLWNARKGDPNSVYNLSADTDYYDLWTPMVMDDTGVPGWIKKFTICLDYFPFNNCLGIVNDKLVLTSCCYMELALCDPQTGTLEVLGIDSKLQKLRKGSACGFVGSLVSIDGFGFESSDLLSKNMCISWPYSLYSSSKESWPCSLYPSSCRKNWKKQRIQ